jgi:hypothetical protein
LTLIVLTDGCMTSQCDKIKTESTETTEKNYTHDKPWICTRKFYKHRNFGENYDIERRKTKGKGN